MNATSDDRLPVPAPDPDGAEAAFNGLAAQVSLLGAAVAGLAARREETADYSETLGQIAAEQQALRKAVETMAARPAMRLTLDSMAQEIAATGQQTRARDEAALADACRQVGWAAWHVERIIGTAAEIRQQRKQIACAAGGGLVAGLLIGMVLPGMIARELPRSWHIPERIARHMVGEPSLWEAGVRLMRTDAPGIWEATRAAIDMRRANSTVIGGCEQTAARTAKPVQCVITITPKEGG